MLVLVSDGALDGASTTGSIHRVMPENETSPPACPKCGKPLRLDRVAASVLSYPELRTYTCPSCWGEVVVLPDNDDDNGRS